MVSQALKRKAYSLGADDIVESWRGYKKYAVLYKDKWIHFGDMRYDDYTTHRDEYRRDSYRRRAASITNKYGEYTLVDDGLSGHHRQGSDLDTCVKGTRIRTRTIPIFGHIIYSGKKIYF